MNTQKLYSEQMILLKFYLITVINLVIIIPIKHIIYTQNAFLHLITLGGTFHYLQTSGLSASF